MKESALQKAMDEAGDFGWGASPNVSGHTLVSDATALVAKVRKTEKLFANAIAAIDSSLLEEAIAFAAVFGYGDASKAVAGVEVKTKAQALKVM